MKKKFVRLLLKPNEIIRIGRKMEVMRREDVDMFRERESLIAHNVVFGSCRNTLAQVNENVLRQTAFLFLHGTGYPLGVRTDGSIAFGSTYRFSSKFPEFLETLISEGPVLACPFSKKRFVQFANGLQRSLPPRGSNFRRVALALFGPGNSYFKFDNNTYKHKHLPFALSELIYKVEKFQLPSIEYLSLGPKGQFFVRFANGKHKSGGLSKNDKRFIAKIPNI